MKTYVRYDITFPQLNFKGYRKTTVTQAARMDGPFRVLTAEGPLECKDGYLAIDSRGYPYPIDREEFEAIYEEVINES
jgi:hypothetical protein